MVILSRGILSYGGYCLDIGSIVGQKHAYVRDTVQNVISAVKPGGGSLTGGSARQAQCWTNVPL